MSFLDRISVLEICNHEFPGGVGVEVGVAGGHFARQILATWKTIGKLNLVDPWKHFDESKFEEGYVDGYNLDDETQEARYQDIVKHFSPDSRVNIIRLESLEAAEKFPPRCANFIYIDANHCYQAAKKDLNAWWGNLKRGGIMAGHDYYNSGNAYEVKKAVDEFAKASQLTVHSTQRQFSRPSAIYGASWEGPSWVIRKP